jgi:3-methylfumaryl-CoA hydratase
MSVADMDRLQDSVGRREVATDRLDAGQAARVALTLNHARAPAEGEALPPLWHWSFFPPQARQGELGADGHPRLGGFLPLPLPRRMWAGGRLRFAAPLRVGEPVERETEIMALTEKAGRQGALVFLTLRHRLTGPDGLAIEEEQDIVYREPGATARPAPVDAPAAPADWRDRIEPDPTLLFRYSAVTFNAHRIHYDLAYATGEEGYPALVVQGPLTATLLADALVRHTGGRIVEFAFRGQAPLFADAAFHVCGARDGDGFRLWAEGPGGYVAMSATARIEGGA